MATSLEQKTAAAGFFSWLFGKGGMKRTILVPFVLLILLGFGAGWVFYVQGSRTAVLRAADLLAEEAAARIQDRLKSYLGAAADVARDNAILLGSLDDTREHARFLPGAFRRQLFDRAEIDLLSVGFSDGEYAEAQRLTDGRVRIGRAGLATQGALVLERVDEEGRPVAEELRKPGYDPRNRPWYQAAKAAGRLVWTAPYPIVSTGELAMAAAVPISAGNRIAGVTTADLRLGALSSFLATLMAERSGFAYVLDGEGRLIAASDGQALASPEGARHLVAEHGGPAAVIMEGLRGAGRGKAVVRIEGLSYRALSLAFVETGSLSWTILLALPESGFLAPLASANIRNGFILILTLVLALAFAFFAAHRIAEPLKELGGAVGALEDSVLKRLQSGASPQSAEALAVIRELAERKDEIGRLAQVFDELSASLGESFSSLRSSLDEKEVLLKEVHHRVKNNLQIISSLLSLQAGSAEDPSVSESLKTLQDRVQAMAFVHEDMYGSGNRGAVRMDLYFQRIGESLASSRQSDCEISVEVQPGGVELPLERALPCGLIVSELTTNAFKHAFRGKTCGVIAVSLQAAAEGYALTVSDDGVGMSAKPLEESRGSGIGSSLVEGLASQLKGRLEKESDSGGTSVRILFPR